jgi:hypothetical protein
MLIMLIMCLVAVKHLDHVNIKLYILFSDAIFLYLYKKKYSKYELKKLYASLLFIS